MLLIVNPDEDQGQPLREVAPIVRLNPGLAEAYYFRGVAYDKQGSKSEAEADLAQAKKLGMDKRGHGNGPGLVTTPAAAYFTEQAARQPDKRLEARKLITARAKARRDWPGLPPGMGMALNEMPEGKETVTFRVQIPDAMRLYKAANGSAPRTHEEFMEKIIKENRIQLPDLPPGHRYIYLPDREELMVERPR